MKIVGRESALTRLKVPKYLAHPQEVARWFVAWIPVGRHGDGWNSSLTTDLVIPKCVRDALEKQ